MTAVAARVRHELIGLGGVVERNWYLVKRYVWWEVAFFFWTCANTLTIVFIASSFWTAGDAPTPFAMNTIVSVFAHVQKKKATSHQT